MARCILLGRRGLTEPPDIWLTRLDEQSHADTSMHTKGGGGKEGL